MISQNIRFVALATVFQTTAFRSERALGVERIGIEAVWLHSESRLAVADSELIGYHLHLHLHLGCDDPIYRPIEPCSSSLTELHETPLGLIMDDEHTCFIECTCKVMGCICLQGNESCWYKAAIDRMGGRKIHIEERIEKSLGGDSANGSDEHASAFVFFSHRLLWIRKTQSKSAFHVNELVGVYFRL
ncbi:unnamed protein product [Mycena citricolor]|uniref:Uncharacterized protein n=1 Tax=Mycena citricolor TaxID=2018698 RepID=A0AAD2HH44_9AGAR|nr:unnamed protein product [Mycena citricolor]CAK5275115.1 unnamed protein product [Mycena citricolor]